MLNISELKNLSIKIRKHAINMTNAGKSSHVGSILSIADIITVLYGSVMNFRPSEPKWPDRDRLILSKGHAGAGIYSILAEMGFMKLEKLKSHCMNGSDLSGHVSHKGIPGVELSTGSLGHGLSVAAGMSLASKINNKNYKTFVLMSDGECNEGSVWEAALFANHHKLDNLISIIDRNKLQSIHSTEETLKLEPLLDKWKAFGWNVVKVDGHNFEEIQKSLINYDKGKPLCLIAETIKGKGISFMENNNLWHYRSPQDEEYEAAITELDNTAIIELENKDA